MAAKPEIDIHNFLNGKSSSSIAKRENLKLPSPVFSLVNGEMHLIINSEDLIRVSKEGIAPEGTINASTGIKVFGVGKDEFGLNLDAKEFQNSPIFSEIEEDWGKGFYKYNISDLVTLLEVNEDCVVNSGLNKLELSAGESFTFDSREGDLVKLTSKDIEEIFVPDDFDFVNLKNIDSICLPDNSIVQTDAHCTAIKGEYAKSLDKNRENGLSK